MCASEATLEDGEHYASSQPARTVYISLQAVQVLGCRENCSCGGCNNVVFCRSCPTAHDNLPGARNISGIHCISDFYSCSCAPGSNGLDLFHGSHKYFGSPCFIDSGNYEDSHDFSGSPAVPGCHSLHGLHVFHGSFGFHRCRDSHDDYRG